MYFINYSKCSTCKRAKKFLDDNNISYIDRQIKEGKPSYDEIKSWINISILNVSNTLFIIIFLLFLTSLYFF